MATFLQNNDEKDENKDSQQGPLQTIGTAAPQASASNPAASSVQKPQGSGRFTNLQKYLSANQGAGQRIAQQVGGNINRDLQQKQQQANQYYQQLGQNIANANATAQQGAAFQRQLQNMGTDIKSAQDAGFNQRDNVNLASLENFVNQPNFNQFQNIQAGRGIDENLLALQQQRAYNQANQAVMSAEAAKQQLANEGGRFELLRQAFGGSTRPGYTQGQQRLDQVLLGQGGGLGAVQANVAQQARDLQAQARQASEQSGEVARLAAAERGLVGDINTQAAANEKAYMDMLRSYIDPLNQQRAAEVQSLNDAIASYKKDAKGYTPGFTQEQLERLGAGNLGANTGVYNVFENDVKGAQDLATLGRQATTAQDVATQADVNRYAALAKILGQERLSAPALTKASDLEASYTGRTDQGNLATRLTDADKAFQDMANARRVSSGEIAGHELYGNLGNMLASGTNAGRAVRSGYSNDYNMSLTDYINRWGGGANPGSQLQSLFGNIRGILDQNNYNRTLGGQRRTFLDTFNDQYRGGTPKLDPVPITGEDPSLDKGSKK